MNWIGKLLGKGKKPGRKIGCDRCTREKKQPVFYEFQREETGMDVYKCPECGYERYITR